MTFKQFSLSDDYRKVAEGTRRLHHLALEHRDQTDEADVVRDGMDEPWYKLSDFEQQQVEGLSADLRSLEYTRDEPATFSSNEMQILAEAFGVNHSGMPGEALAILRAHAAIIPLPTLSYARAVCFSSLGDNESALLFAEYAAKARPDDEKCVALANLLRGRKGPWIAWAEDSAFPTEISQPQ